VKHAISRARHPVIELAALGRSRRTEELQAPVTAAPPHPAPRGDIPDALRAGDAQLRGALPARVARSVGAARVDPVAGLAWVGTTVLNPPFVDDPGYAERLLRRSFARTRRRPRTGTGDAYLLAHVWERNAYHLLLDLLTQLRFIEQLDMRTAIVSPALAATPLFAELVLANPHFGVINFVATTDVRRLERVTFGAAGWPTTSTVAYLVEAFAPPAAAPGNDQRLLVLRQEHDGRCITNEAEVLRTVERFGFTPIRPEELSAREQIDAFSRARIVVGVHGAGLANIVFRGHASLDLLELLPSRLEHPFYYNLARCLGAGYHALGVTSGEGAPRDAAVTVDCGALERRIGDVVGRV
jgi:Glycosyltransferase 61